MAGTFPNSYTESATRAPWYGNGHGRQAELGAFRRTTRPEEYSTFPQARTDPHSHTYSMGTQAASFFRTHTHSHKYRMSSQAASIFRAHIYSHTHRMGLRAILLRYKKGGFAPSQTCSTRLFHILVSSLCALHTCLLPIPPSSCDPSLRYPF